MAFATATVRMPSNAEINTLCMFRRGQRLSLTFPVEDVHYDAMRRSLRIDTLYTYNSSAAPSRRISVFVNNVDKVDAGMEIARFEEASERAESEGNGAVACVTLEVKIDTPSNVKNMSANPEMSAILIRGEIKVYPFTLRAWYTPHNERSSSLRFGTGRF